MIKKALCQTFEQLLSLNLPLWIQVGGMSASISLGVIVFSSYHSGISTLGLALLLLVELFIVLFSISNFSIYLAKIAARRAEKLGLRKTLGTSGWALFLETSAQTTLLVLLAIVFSIGLIDVSLLFTSMKFEILLKSWGVLHYGALLLAVFILSEALLFIIQGVALAPNAKTEFEATTLFEKTWLLKLAKALGNLSLVFGLLTAFSFLLLMFSLPLTSETTLLYMVFYPLLAIWWIINKRYA